ncbi:hypothetical protein L195_g040142, partial [Trifolium pratense]
MNTIAAVGAPPVAAVAAAALGAVQAVPS